ncbi:sigma-70 family RNA polymerase sigma factor [Schlesneria paludicola]|uniref:sigma-70 family RNA polymerase sigma factor n=1 Tax=Schlesneria paludicola TaxID=360056 RepID=UPI00029B4A09|nr:sigma-70 family RNA polymerase sigma factor [Schlesneria paludicola]
MAEAEHETTENEANAARLLAITKTGSGDALGPLLECYRTYLVLMADVELGPDLKVKASASDLVQESFLEAARDFSHFQGESPAQFQAWLRRILLNNIANIARDFRCTEKRNLSKEVSLSARDDDQSSSISLSSKDRTASSIVIRRETENALQQAIRRLPDHYQDLIRWRNYDRKSFDEIGRCLNKSDEAARKLWVRALELLQKELDSINDSIAPRSRNRAE